MICGGCGKESADEFNFCPHCGKAFVHRPSVIESSSPSPEVQSVQNTPTDESEPIKDGVAGTTIRVGTLVFGAFSAISLLVSIIKGIVPIYLLEAAAWAGAAWYWQGKKTHSDVAKAIVIVLAVLVGIGEVVHMVSQAGSKPAAPTASDPFAAYGGHEVASAEASAASHVADVEKQAIALFNQKHYTEARSLFEQACNGTDENGFKYAGFDGEMKACNYLGYLYAKGLGGTRDTKKAREVYQRACDQGVLSSCASLGSLYQDARNSDEARKYFNKACQGGVTEACSLLRGVE
jgi:tetratricopeptide (TPR) repeat protein